MFGADPIWRSVVVRQDKRVDISRALAPMRLEGNGVQTRRHTFALSPSYNLSPASVPIPNVTLAFDSDNS